MPVTNGSGSGSRRPKNRWIRIRIQIRIRNTGCKPSVRQRNNCTYISMLHSEMVIPSSASPKYWTDFLDFFQPLFNTIRIFTLYLTDDGINFVLKKVFVKGAYVLFNAVLQIRICFKGKNQVYQLFLSIFRLQDQDPHSLFGSGSGSRTVK